jgi:single-strand DNA-binding protein
MNVNKVILVGRLTRDPEIRNTPGGQSVATLSLATNRFWKDKSGQRQDKTEFHTVILWGRTAEVAGQYLTKGQEALIEGRMETRKYTAKDGTERRVTEVIGETMQLGSRAGAGTGTPGSFNKSTTAQPNAVKKPQVEMEEEIPTINLDEQDEIRLEDVPF